MTVVPPRHYCVVENPVLRDKDGKVVVDKSGQVKLQHADLEIRLAQDPFPLYPGEVLKQVSLVTHLTDHYEYGHAFISAFSAIQKKNRKKERKLKKQFGSAKKVPGKNVP